MIVIAIMVCLKLYRRLKSVVSLSHEINQSPQRNPFNLRLGLEKREVISALSSACNWVL